MTDYVRDVWRLRYFWMSLVRNDLRSRYRRSLLGIGWSLLHPIAMAAVLCTVFSQVFHVEIKPGPLTVEEGERCRALCQFLNQNVLCVSGGHVSDSQLSFEASMTGSGVDYAQLQRFRPCVEMCLYAPQGVDAAPLLYPAVMWHFGDGSSTPFLSMLDHSNSRQKEDARLRLLQIYHQATKDATKFSRRSEPY